jgi:hypothetical protein
VAQENHTLTFAALSSEQKQAVREDAEERYISYPFLCQSGAQHGNLKVDLRNDFTTSSNQYPKTRQQKSSMDLICDQPLVESTFKSSHSMRLKSNGGTMEVKTQAIIPGYHAHVWYNKKTITNILSLSNVIKLTRFA